MSYEDNMVSVQILPRLPQRDFPVIPAHGGWSDAFERVMAVYSHLPLLDGLPTNSELKAWVANQDLKPLPSESWRPYRPEVAAPFYARTANQ